MDLQALFESHIIVVFEKKLVHDAFYSIFLFDEVEWDGARESPSHKNVSL